MSVSTVKKYVDDVLDSTTTSTYTYDAQGIRVQQTTQVDSGPVQTTNYLYDPNNHTGYAQVLEEKDGSGNITKTYTLGHDVIAQQAPDVVGGDSLTFLYDDHGSTRALLTTAGLIATNPNAGGAKQLFTFDAYGNPLTHGPFAAASAALTILLYSGELTDSTTGMQYLRARYYDPASGRFTRLDPFAGNVNDPVSLHKYLYTHGNPVMGIDPTGLFEFSITGLLVNSAVSTIIGYVLAPIVKPALNYFTKAVMNIMPKVADAALPSAWIFGIGLGYNFPIPKTPIGFTGNLTYERVSSLGKSAVANFLSFKAQFSSRRPSGGLAGIQIPLSIGLAWNLHSSTQYEGASIGISVPYKSLDAKWRSRIWSALSNGVANLLPAINVLSDFPELQSSYTSDIAGRIADLTSKITHGLDRFEVSFFTGAGWDYLGVELTADVGFWHSSEGAVHPSFDVGGSLLLNSHEVQF